MKKVKMTKKTKNILWIILAGVLLFGAIFGIMALVHNTDEQTQKTISPKYSVGALATDGKYKEDKGSIYTKDSFDCLGINTVLTFDNDISYSLYFYDENDEFISKTDVLRVRFESNVPFSARKCRVVITPNNDDNIKWYEVNNYAKQLTIKVDKEQKFDLMKEVKKATDVCSMCGQGRFDGNTRTFLADNAFPYYVSNDINTSNATLLVARVNTSSLTGKVSINSSLSLDKVIFYTDNTNTSNYDVISSANDYSYISINVENISAVTVLVDSASANCLQLFVF